MDKYGRWMIKKLVMKREKGSEIKKERKKVMNDF